MTITVVGSANMDMVINAPRQPKIGESIHGTGYFLSPGGKGANQAAACAKMGADTYFVGKVGTDVFGKTLKQNLADLKVSADYLQTGGNTGVALITVVGGDNYIVCDAGANMELTTDEILKCEQHLIHSDAVLLQFEIPMSVNEKIMDVCRGKTTVFLNPAPAAAMDKTYLRGLDFFTPNETEAPYYTGITVDGLAGAFKSLDALRAMGVKYPIITLGENGVVYFNGKKNMYLEAFKVGAVDTTAAGDTFSGALAFMVAGGKDIDNAVKFASAAAAISVTRPGAQNSIPSYAEVEAFLATR